MENACCSCIYYHYCVSALDGVLCTDFMQASKEEIEKNKKLDKVRRKANFVTLIEKEAEA